MSVLRATQIIRSAVRCAPTAVSATRTFVSSTSVTQQVTSINEENNKSEIDSHSVTPRESTASTPPPGLRLSEKLLSISPSHEPDSANATSTSKSKSNPNDIEEFTIPGCLIPAESLPITHGVHVATLHLRSYSNSLSNLDLFTEFARKAAQAIGIPAGKPVHLPTRTALWTVPRSPFVHKKSQENFWRKTHSRCIKLWDANDQVVDAWLHFLRIHALPGVGMKAQLFRYHALGVGEKILKNSKSLSWPNEKVRHALVKKQIIQEKQEREAQKERQAEIEAQTNKDNAASQPSALEHGEASEQEQLEAVQQSEQTTKLSEPEPNESQPESDSTATATEGVETEEAVKSQ